MKKSIIIFTIVLLLAGYIGCTQDQSKPDVNFLNFFIGNVEVIRPGGKTEPAGIKMPLFREDTVKTGAESIAYIQCGEDNIIQLFENTSLEMKILPENIISSEDTTSLKLIGGRITVFTEKLSKKGSFNVNLGTHAVAVRGTTFSVEKNREKVILMTLEGSVSIKNETNGQELVVSSGEKAVIEGDSVKATKMSDAESAVFRDINRLSPVAGINCVQPGQIERYFQRSLGIKKIIEKKSSEDREKNGAGRSDQSVDNTDNNAQAETRLRINTLVANGVDSKVTNDITSKIFTRLSASKGTNRVLMGMTNKSANRQLTGRVSKLGSTFILAVSVTDGQSGKVFYNKTFSYKEGENVDGRVDQIAADINGNANIWEKQ